jgi:hypothetical protein
MHLGSSYIMKLDHIFNLGLFNINSKLVLDIWELIMRIEEH